MSVRQRTWLDKNGHKQTAWLVDVRIEGHPRIKKVSPVSTRKGALTFELQIRTAILDGSWGKRRVEIPSFKAFSVRWLEHSETHNKLSTLKSKRDILRLHLTPAVGSLLLDSISRQWIDSFKAQKLREKLTKKSINNILAVLSNLLETAHEWGELPQVPVIKWFKLQPPPFDFLTFEEAERLARLAEPGRWATMIKLILNTGLRIGEVAGLRWEDVDLAAGRLVVRRRVYRGTLDTPKGGKARELPLNASAVEALRSFPPRLDSPYVFPQRDGKFIRNPQHAAVHAIARNAKLAGLRPIGWHTLRHTFASHLVMRGIPLRTVQELLGHSSSKMTERYAHLMPEISKTAVNVLDSAHGRALVDPGSADGRADLRPDGEARGLDSAHLGPNHVRVSDISPQPPETPTLN